MESCRTRQTVIPQAPCSVVKRKRRCEAALRAQDGKVAKPDKLLDDSDSEEEVADVEFQVSGY